MTAISWRGLTADYTEAERNTIRNLALVALDEAVVLHEFKAILDATMVDTGTRKLYAGAEGRWDERRNTSLVRPTGDMAALRIELDAYADREPVPDQLRMDEAA